MNPWIILAVVLTWMASLMAVGTWQNSTGKESERVSWQAREIKEVVDANNTIQKLQDDARKSEGTHAQALADISKNFQERIDDVENDKDKFIAGIRSGAIVLRQPNTTSQNASSGISAEAIASASRRDGEADSELSRETSEFLYGESTKADKITEQLAACQLIVIEDRNICGIKSDSINGHN